MNREQAKELLPIIQAFAEGKEIQCKQADGTWYSSDGWSFQGHNEYRIKPEPRVRYINLYKDEDFVYKTKQGAKACSRGLQYEGERAVKFQEVL